MATKLLTLATYATLTFSSACQVAPVEPRRETLASVTITATPKAAPELSGSEPAPMPLLAQEKAATPTKKAPAAPKAKRPRPAAQLTPTAAPQLATPVSLEEPLDVSALSSQMSEIATPRVDQDDRPATGNVVSRRANNR